MLTDTAYGVPVFDGSDVVATPLYLLEPHVHTLMLWDPCLGDSLWSHIIKQCLCAWLVVVRQRRGAVKPF